MYILFYRRSKLSSSAVLTRIQAVSRQTDHSGAIGTTAATNSTSADTSHARNLISIPLLNEAELETNDSQQSDRRSRSASDINQSQNILNCLESTFRESSTEEQVIRISSESEAADSPPSRTSEVNKKAPSTSVLASTNDVPTTKQGVQLENVSHPQQIEQQANVQQQQSAQQKDRIPHQSQQQKTWSPQQQSTAPQNPTEHQMQHIPNQLAQNLQQQSQSKPQQSGENGEQTHIQHQIRQQQHHPQIVQRLDDRQNQGIARPQIGPPQQLHNQPQLIRPQQPQQQQQPPGMQQQPPGMQQQPPGMQQQPLGMQQQPTGMQQQSQQQQLLQHQQLVQQQQIQQQQQVLQQVNQQTLQQSQGQFSQIQRQQGPNVQQGQSQQILHSQPIQHAHVSNMNPSTSVLNQGAECSQCINANTSLPANNSTSTRISTASAMNTSIRTDSGFSSNSLVKSVDNSVPENRQQTTDLMSNLGRQLGLDRLQPNQLIVTINQAPSAQINQPTMDPNFMNASNLVPVRDRPTPSTSRDSSSKHASAASKHAGERGSRRYSPQKERLRHRHSRYDSSDEEEEEITRRPSPPPKKKVRTAQRKRKESSSSSDNEPFVKEIETEDVLLEAINRYGIEGFDALDSDDDHDLHTCSVCGRYCETWTIGELKAHMWSKHAMSCACYRCFVCGHDFLKSSKLRKHLSRQHDREIDPDLVDLLNVTAKPFRGSIPQCTRCEYQSISHRLLEGHACSGSAVVKSKPQPASKLDGLVRINTEGEARYYIDKSDIPGMLLEDVRQAARSRDNIFCTYCDATRAYSRHWDYNQHLVTAHGMRCVVFRCFICGHEDITLKDLGSHIRFDHNIIMKRVFLELLGIVVEPFSMEHQMLECEDCSLKCLRNKSLRKHMCGRFDMSVKHFEKELERKARLASVKKEAVMQEDGDENGSNLPESSGSENQNWSRNIRARDRASIGDRHREGRHEENDTLSPYQKAGEGIDVSISNVIEGTYQTDSPVRLDRRQMTSDSSHLLQNPKTCDPKARTSRAAFSHQTQDQSSLRDRPARVSQGQFSSRQNPIQSRISDNTPDISLIQSHVTSTNSSTSQVSETNLTRRIKTEPSDDFCGQESSAHTPARTSSLSNEGASPGNKGQESAPSLETDISHFQVINQVPVKREEDETHQVQANHPKQSGNSNTNRVGNNSESNKASLSSKTLKRVSRSDILHLIKSSPFHEHLDTSFAYRYELETNERGSGKLSQKCDVCKGKFGARELLRHCKAVHGLNVSVFRCYVCGQDVYPVRADMVRHMRKHGVDIEASAVTLLENLVCPYDKIPVCEECGFYTTSDEIMFDHECKK